MPQPSELLDAKRMVREQPDGLHVIDAIMIFRDNIRPEWEDKMNAGGGHFELQSGRALDRSIIFSQEDANYHEDDTFSCNF